jgi:hypothetical protein
MKLPRLRFTVRWLIIAVAIVGVLFGLVIERQSRFRKLASHHQAECEKLLKMPIIMFAGSSDDPVMRRLEWSYPMKLKYESAARYPWLPVAPDAPEPEYLKRPFTPGVPEKLE